MGLGAGIALATSLVGCTTSLPPVTRATVSSGGTMVTHPMAGIGGFEVARRDSDLGHPADRGISRRSIAVTDTWRRLGTSGNRVRETGGDRFRGRTVTITGD